MKVHVAGFGSWGIAFSNLLAKQNADITILTTSFEDPQIFNDTKSHPLFNNLTLHKNIKASSKDQDLGKPDLLVWAVPTKFTTQWLDKDFIKRYSNVDILVLSKGLSPEGFDPIGNWLNRYLKNDIYILSGPNFAT